MITAYPSDPRRRLALCRQMIEDAGANDTDTMRSLGLDLLPERPPYTLEEIEQYSAALDAELTGCQEYRVPNGKQTVVILQTPDEYERMTTKGETE